MRTATITHLFATLLLGGCAAIPISTALQLSRLTPAALAQVDPAQVRVRLSVPTGFEVDIPASRLTLTLTSSAGSRTGAMHLALLGSTHDTRPGGLFRPDQAVTTYALALTPAGAATLRQLQGSVRSGHPHRFEFSVQAPLSRTPPQAKAIRFWAELRLASTEPFMPLLDGAKLRFEHSP